jgi:hypothetical protein
VRPSGRVSSPNGGHQNHWLALQPAGDERQRTCWSGPLRVVDHQDHWVASAASQISWKAASATRNGSASRSPLTPNAASIARRCASDRCSVARWDARAGAARERGSASDSTPTVDRTRPPAPTRCARCSSADLPIPAADDQRSAGHRAGHRRVEGSDWRRVRSGQHL